MIIHMIQYDPTSISEAVDGISRAEDVDKYFKMTIVGDILYVVADYGTDSEYTSEWTRAD